MNCPVYDQVPFACDSITISLPLELTRRVKVICERQHRSASELIEIALSAYLSEGKLKRDAVRNLRQIVCNLDRVTDELEGGAA